MLACILFVFGSLIEYACILFHRGLDTSDEDEEAGGGGGSGGLCFHENRLFGQQMQQQQQQQFPPEHMEMRKILQARENTSR